jgi:hypothetical protein
MKLSVVANLRLISLDEGQDDTQCGRKCAANKLR